jgi:hypothetical protein
VTRPRDPGLALERTTLAWQRTGLSSAAIGAISLRVYWGSGPAGIVLAALFIAIGGLAYAASTSTPVGPTRLRLMSLAVTATAVLGAVLSIVG